MTERIAVFETKAPLAETLAPAVRALQQGALVIFPTETVYGIAARADKPEAVEKIYTAKRRPERKPLSQHVGDWTTLGILIGEVPQQVRVILRKYLPGPYTFLISVRGEKLGVRFPEDIVAQTFLAACRVPVVATSANISGEPSPVNAEMTASVAAHAAYVIDAGPTSFQSDSTVVDLTKMPPECVRQGAGEWKG